MAEDNFDELAEADKLLTEDRDKLEEVLKHAKKENQVSLYLDVALKAKLLADLYFEALEDVSSTFSKYKKLAAEYYLKVGSNLKFADAKVMAILMYLQIGNKKKAEKIFKELTKQASKMQDSKDLDAELEVCKYLFHDPLEELEDQINAKSEALDKNFASEIHKTLQYMLKDFDPAIDDDD
jgi:hypothetical protein